MSSQLKVAESGNTMRAWVLDKQGDINDIQQRQVQVPEPGPKQLRVRVVAASVNPVDVKHAGLPMCAFPAAFGCDCAGVVDAVGAEAAGFAKGDRVHYFGNVFAEFGSFADFALVDATAVVRMPDGLSFADAAATPCAAWTAYEALFDRLKIEKGKTIYIASGAGGVGHLAIQLAKNAGLTVITTASGDHVARLRGEGYLVVDYRAQDVAAEVKRLTNGEGVDYVFDMLGEAEAKVALGLLKYRGSMCHIATTVPPADNGLSFINALTIHHVFIPGNVVRLDEARRFVRIGQAVNELLLKGELKVHISKVHSFAGVKDALIAQKGGHVHGKQIISIVDDAEAIKNPKFKLSS